MLADYPDVLTSKDIMDIMGISKELLYDLIHKKLIPAYKLSKKEWRFNKDSIINYLTSLEKQ